MEFSVTDHQQQPFQDDELQRRNALRAVLCVTLPGAGLMLAYNYQLSATFLCLLNLLLIIVSAGLLLTLRRDYSLRVLALAYLALLDLNVAATVARPDLHPGITASMALVPVLAYLLLEIRYALPATLAGLTALTVAYVVGAGLAPYRIGLAQEAHIIVPVLGLFVVCHFYARGRTDSFHDRVDKVSRDPLTGLWNREKLNSEFARERKRTLRQGTPLSLILIDLDNFKQLNGRYGHDAGDAALGYVARLMERRLRETDLACRIGGEEFAVLLPQTASLGALAVAEDLRGSLEKTPFRHEGRNIRMTLSAGVVELGRDGDDWLDLYRSADERLYKCKNRGRNCVWGGEPAFALFD